MSISEAIVSLVGKIAELKEKINSAWSAYESVFGVAPYDKTLSGLSKAIGSLKGISFSRLDYAFSGHIGDIIPWSLIDTSRCTSMSNTFYQFWKNGSGNKGDGIIDLSSWDTSNVTNMSSMFLQTASNVSEIRLGGKFTTKNVTNFSSMFGYARVPYPLEIDTSKGTNFSMFLYTSQIYTQKYDISALSFDSATNMSNILAYASSITNLIGEHTLEEVENGSIVLFRNLKVDCDLHWSPLDYKNMLACAKGVGDLTGSTTRTFKFHSATFNALSTEEQDTIRNEFSAKNWTLALA